MGRDSSVNLRWVCLRSQARLDNESADLNCLVVSKCTQLHSALAKSLSALQTWTRGAVLRLDCKLEKTTGGLEQGNANLSSRLEQNMSAANSAMVLRAT